jgi:hypothetical protein
MVLVPRLRPEEGSLSMSELRICDFAAGANSKPIRAHETRHIRWKVFVGVGFRIIFLAPSISKANRVDEMRRIRNTHWRQSELLAANLGCEDYSCVAGKSQRLTVEFDIALLATGKRMYYEKPR